MQQLSKKHLLIVILWVCILGYLFVKDYTPFETRFAVKAFDRNQFEITHLFPLGRTTVSDRLQKIIQEPVYIKMYAPRKYKTARVIVIAEKPLEGWQIGIQVGPGFQYSLQELAPIKKQVAVLDAEHAYYENNTLRFILAYPDGDLVTPVTIHEYKVILEGHTESYKDAWLRNAQKLYEKFTTRN